MKMSSENRFRRIHVPKFDDVFHLAHMRGTERLSGLFDFDVTLTSENLDVRFEDVVGEPMALELQDGSGERFFHGIVASFGHESSGGDRNLYRARIVPWLWLLGRSTDCRIFQNKSVVEIVSEVFDGLGQSQYRFEVDSASYEPIEFCVQYRESDLDFVQRLLASHGIGFYFEHAKDRHTLVLFDPSHKNPECPQHGVVSFVADESEQTGGIVGRWESQVELRSGAVALNDFQYEDPSVDLLATRPTAAPVGGNEKLEIYDYPGEYGKASEGNARALLRIEAEEAASSRVQGSSTCPDFSPGHCFTLRGHDRRGTDGLYRVTSVTHEFGEQGYGNDFECMPGTVPYRPLPRPKPSIVGAQTAIVVGESGSEIDVDEYGSAFVRFHWDRRDKSLPSPTCRIRVAQALAGAGFGGYFAPRIGQEVIVEFLAGDPDRPIITGRVYNGQNKPPYEAPEVGGVKTQSTREGGVEDFNEIRLDDTKDSELVFVQAQKDWEANVKNDAREGVGHDRTRSVGNDESVSVKNDRTVSVEHDHSESIGNDETLDVGKNRTRNVGEAEQVSVGKSQSLDVGTERTLSVGAGQTISVEKDQDETVGGSYTIRIEKDWSGQSETLTFDVNKKIVLRVGKAQIEMNDNGDILIKGGNITLKGKGDITHKGKRVLQN